MRIKWVVFDLGDVVLQRTEALPALAQLLSVDRERFVEAYWLHRRDYDLRSDAGEFWPAVAAGAGAPTPTAQLVSDLVRVDDLGWSLADPAVLSLIDEVKETGVSLAVLSNAPSSMGRLIESAPWADRFEHLLFSGDLTLVKPDAEIFASLLETLGSPGAEVVFLDDRADNITGAARAGIHGLVYTTLAQARADLRRAGIPIPS